MDYQTGHVLKAENVKVAGTYHLDLNQSAAVSANTSQAVCSEPQVRIVDNNDEFAVLELTCGCGTKTRIRCEYAKGS